MDGEQPVGAAFKACRVAVLGSSISRHLLNHADRGSYTIVENAARQSLASAFAPKRADWRDHALPGLTDAWHRRLALCDAAGAYGALIRGLPDPDLMLYDLVDERGGVYVFPDGAVLTCNPEMAQSGLLDATGRTEVVPFGSDEHFSRWTSGFDHLIGELRSVGRLSAFVCLLHQWATSSTEGLSAPFGKSRLNPGVMNETMGRYADHVRDSGVQYLEVPNELCVSSQSHPRGLAPYHYADGFYRYLVRRLEGYGLRLAKVELDAPRQSLVSHGRSSILYGVTQDDHIFRQIRETKDYYESELLQATDPFIRAGDCVVDVGAFIGNHSVYWATVSGARVFAFEPWPESFRALVANISVNSLDGFIYPRRYALGAVEGRAMATPPVHHNLGSIQLEAAEVGEVVVKTLDSALMDAVSPVRLLKIDVEGWELDVLIGGRQLLKRDRPIVIVECQDDAAFRQVDKFMQEARYMLREVFNATPTYLYLPSDFEYPPNYTKWHHLAHISARTSRRSVLNKNAIQRLARRVTALEGE